jgi:FKBP-type peptidyl-prolyl cis-trans isomerase 2
VDDKKYSKTISTKVIEEDDTVVKEGDKVEVDYFGYLGTFVLFDTSIQDIGRESSLTSTPEFPPPGKRYEPLDVYVGPEDDDTDDSYTTTVEGFWEGIIGMSEGQSRTIGVPPVKGYGMFENITINITEEVPMTEIMTFAGFRTYYDEAIIEGITLKHHFWDWNVSIDYVNETEDVVRLINEPHLNETSNPYRWESKVIYKNQSDHGGEGLILVKHDAHVGDRAIYKGFDADVTDVGDGQISLFYNKSGDPLGIQVLLFDITLLKIAE